MKIERLEELQQSINAQRSIGPEEGSALISEIGGYGLRRLANLKSAICRTGMTG
jgi:hypothetical protein